MKKILSIMTILALLLTLFAGCGGSADEPSAQNDGGSANVTTEGANAGASTDDNSGGLSGKVATNGSTSMEKVIGSLAEAFMAQNGGVDVTYDPTGSGSGITAVNDGTTDIGLSSRALKDSETEDGLEGITIALDGIAIVVNNANTVENLTLEQIAGLANGTYENWSEVGGPDAPVVLIGREAGSGTRDGFESIVGVDDECVYQQELTSTGAVIAAVAANENAIGYASLSSVGDDVKAVSVDGVAPSEETVLDGSYAVQRPFVFVVKAGETLSAEVQAFIDFALSADATQIIADAGAVQAR